MDVYNPSADRQTQARTLKCLPAVQALKKGKHLGKILFIETYAIVYKHDLLKPISKFAGYGNNRRPFSAGIFKCVIDDISKKLTHHAQVAFDNRKCVVIYNCFFFG